MKWEYSLFSGVLISSIQYQFAFYINIPVYPQNQTTSTVSAVKGIVPRLQTPGSYFLVLKLLPRANPISPVHFSMIVTLSTLVEADKPLGYAAYCGTIYM